MAVEAKVIADNTTQAADGLPEGLSEAEQRYDELTKKVESLGGGAVGNINQRAKDMKKEADDLLTKAKEGIKKLKKLEEKFKKNKKRMEDQRLELSELESNVTKVREHIREEAQRLATCV